MLTYLYRILRPYAGWYLLGTVFLLATNLLSVTIPVYLAQGVDALARGPEGRPDVVFSAGVVAVMGFAVIGVRTVSRVLFFTPGRLVEAAVKREVFASMLSHQPAFLRSFATGDLFSRVSSDVSMMRLLAGFGVLQVVNVVLAVVLAGGQMVRISPVLAGWLLLPIGAALIIVQLYIRRLFLLLRRLQVELASLSDHVLASYRGVATVQGFVAEEPFTERFDTLNTTYQRTLVQRAEIRALLAPTLDLAVALDVFLLLFVGGPMVVEGTLTVGELVALTSLVAFVAIPLRGSSFLVSILKQGQAAWERISVFLDTPPDRPEGPTGQPPADRAPTLELRDLTFTWPDADEPALSHVSLTVPPGSTLGILGPTGAGKSTLLSLLARLHNPPEGQVLIDGVDLRQLDLDAWRERMTLVPQRAYLFSESVADNILLGPRDDERLQHALDITALRPDIEALPDGVETEVGETGVRLSGGQRQRAALARGLVRPSRLLLLDDVLSAVDHRTEAELIATLQAAGGDGGLTTVIVAHRVSALMHADQVLVLEHGTVSALGRPAELVEQPGLFRDTWLQQQADRDDGGVA